MKVPACGFKGGDLSLSLVVLWPDRREQCGELRQSLALIITLSGAFVRWCFYLSGLLKSQRHVLGFWGGDPAETGDLVAALTETKACRAEEVMMVALN